MPHRNLIVVIAGGIGNQLFMYATARRLAEKNHARLLLDIDSRFASDSYRQTFQLDRFNIPLEIAPSHLQYNQRWTRFRRNAYLKINRFLPYHMRWIILEETDKNKMASFDPRLLNLTLSHDDCYILDLFNCENYFIDIRSRLRKEITVKPPFNDKTNEIAEKIRSTNSAVAIHARQLRGYPNVQNPDRSQLYKQKSFLYYDRAIKYVAEKVESPFFFCFGDDPTWLRQNWQYRYPVIFVSHNNTQDEAVQDFHLMSLCKHYIVGNSTFSWWPAWLSESSDNIIVAPANEGDDLWSGNRDVIPPDWFVI
jgi:hypothetical protein